MFVNSHYYIVTNTIFLWYDQRGPCIAMLSFNLTAVINICKYILIKLVNHRYVQPVKDGGEEEGDAEEQEKDEEEVEIPVTPEPKEWISQQSDVEIREAVVENSRPLVCSMQYVVCGMYYVYSIHVGI